MGKNYPKCSVLRVGLCVLYGDHINRNGASSENPEDTLGLLDITVKVLRNKTVKVRRSGPCRPVSAPSGLPIGQTWVPTLAGLDVGGVG